MDHFWNLVLSPSFYSIVLPNGYHLLNARLGKVISGKKLTTRTINCAINEIADHPMSKTHLDEMVERFWKCESLGIGDEATRSDDITFLDFFNNITRYDETELRYYTRLPFKLKQESVPDNFDHSFACLRSNWKILSKKPEYLDKYNDIIQDQLRRGIIGKPPSSQPSEPGTFLSHHAVINESKKQTKIRLVYNDASRNAYCAVAYLRIENSQNVDTRLLMVRARLAPLHSTVTIPRLELSALTLGLTLMSHLTKELKIATNRLYIWSDSKTALQWTKTPSSLPVFVQNRVKAIRKNAPSSILRHVPTNLNPADSGSRGSTIH
ncbi:hypothetical protein NECAME_10259 [Necator americanus]|uniref:Pao retrotransposon peptidase n=1 Tax=Necator americanus TaxID=51031 RepID=W2T9L5_NECAM|nr:hypothetical protein NECAME_10259 [Necator americanus]ETN78563.1 hypothetical protein NECAME_10259 [Necator americanus]